MLGKKEEPKNWHEILEEYVDSVKTEKSKSIFKCWKNIIFLEYKMSLLALCLEILRMKHSEKIANTVMELGYDLILDDENRQNQIDGIEMEAKNLPILLNQYKAEYDLLTRSDPSKPKPKKDELYYEEEIAILSKFMGFNIDTEKTFMIRYIAMQNHFLAYHKPEKKAA